MEAACVKLGAKGNTVLVLTNSLNYRSASSECVFAEKTASSVGNCVNLLATNRKEVLSASSL